MVEVVYWVLVIEKEIDYLVVEIMGIVDFFLIILIFLIIELRKLIRIDLILIVVDFEIFFLNYFDSEVILK